VPPRGLAAKLALVYRPLGPTLAAALGTHPTALTRALERHLRPHRPTGRDLRRGGAQGRPARGGDQRISIALGTRRGVPSRHSMGDGSWSVTFENVEVVRRGDLVLMCRVGQKIVGVPLRRMLSGTTVLTVDRGRLVLA